MTTASWIGVLHQQRIPCGPILDLRQVFEDPQVHHNGMVVEHRDATGGSRRLLGFPVKLSEATAAVRLPAPALGQHTAGILGELGYSATLIDQLRRDKVV